MQHGAPEYRRGEEEEEAAEAAAAKKLQAVGDDEEKLRTMRDEGDCQQNPPSEVCKGSGIGEEKFQRRFLQPCLSQFQLESSGRPGKLARAEHCGRCRFSCVEALKPPPPLQPPHPPNPLPLLQPSRTRKC